jgi:sRNA-binding carbon storage regulator CsrA
MKIMPRWVDDSIVIGEDVTLTITSVDTTRGEATIAIDMSSCGNHVKVTGGVDGSFMIGDRVTVDLVSIDRARKKVQVGVSTSPDITVIRAEEVGKPRAFQNGDASGEIRLLDGFRLESAQSLAMPATAATRS